MVIEWCIGKVSSHLDLVVAGDIQNKLASRTIDLGGDPRAEESAPRFREKWNVLLAGYISRKRAGKHPHDI